MTELDPWLCTWCHRPHVVPSLARDHEHTCPARPTNPKPSAQPTSVKE